MWMVQICWSHHYGFKSFEVYDTMMEPSVRIYIHTLLSFINHRILYRRVVINIHISLHKVILRQEESFEIYK